MLWRDLTDVASTSDMHLFDAKSLDLHGGAAIYGACHSVKQRMVPYSGRGVHIFDSVNEYLV